MNCYFHEQNKAIAKCKSCALHYCRQCVQAAGDEGLCPVCQKKALKKLREQIRIKKAASINRTMYCGVGSVLLAVLAALVTQWMLLFVIAAVLFAVGALVFVIDYFTMNKTIARLDGFIAAITKDLDEVLRVLRSKPE